MPSPVQPIQTCAISVQELDQFYGETQILRGIDLRLQRGRTLALLGPSGCGKTTLLRLIAGLLTPSRGIVSIDNKVMADASNGTFVAPERRGLGMVFQDYALWPHMSVAENVGFPLEMRAVSRADRQRRVEAALARVSLAGFGARRPGDLSGGQQQRVAIARAIVAEPRIVLFDEPLSNLDRELRESLVGEIARLVSSLGLTAVYVTHDHSEAFTLADEVAIMQGGEIVQLAAPETLVEHPASLAVAEFLKLGTTASAIKQDGRWRLAGTEVVLPDPAGSTPAGKAKVLFGRNALQATEPGTGTVDGTVIESRFRGDGYALQVSLDTGGTLTLPVTSDRRSRPGDRIGIAIESRNLRWFAAEQFPQQGYQPC
ncbi:MAG: ABC transporter ATP-binding protein [Rhizobiaceae bacterium]|nr:ABC transporter ATP-binding protein [Rhizobiaceae bacterium]